MATTEARSVSAKGGTDTWDPGRLRAFSNRWSNVRSGERANAQLYLAELTDALDVPPPDPAGSDYAFEFPIPITTREGRETTNYADLFKKGCFVLEAKHYQARKDNDLLLRRAFGQALSYSSHLPGGPPPYLMVLDVGRTLRVWDRWSGSYSGFASGLPINLRKLHEQPDHVRLLRNIWLDPHREDTSGRAAQVTKEVAAELAELAAALERRGYEQEGVARFLMRCVFSMFAEDIGLLPERQFEEAVEVGLRRQEDFPEVASELWCAMDEGRRFGLRKLLVFNGHFFKEREALPLTGQELEVLNRAAKHDWALVEPSILGTLLVRALDPAERHRLGAQYTPREFVERVVRPTIEEPLRTKWQDVQEEVLQLRNRGRKRDALAALRRFHAYLCGLKVLDPACGSGNFLYVALIAIKRLEYEVMREIEDITGAMELVVPQKRLEVGPWQFHGIEVRPWARELAELTLWIGYHQFWHDRHGGTLPPEPVLRDIDTLECRDAVLAWDEIIEDPERSRPDPTPRIPHPVTGKLVPNPEARLPYLVHRRARPAEWPEADFIVGNPPYMGRGRQREAFGDGYVDALRHVYGTLFNNADYVMYWWYRSAKEIAAGRAIRAGMITTNTITQSNNRQVIQAAADDDVRILWAIPDHPWVDESGAADVRVAMTVLGLNPSAATLVTVSRHGDILETRQAPRLNGDLTIYADVARTSDTLLLANCGLSSQGFILVGSGFVLDYDEAQSLLSQDPAHAEILRPYMTGRDLAHRDRAQFIIDFDLRSEGEARTFPVLYDIVRSRVKPQRDNTSRKSMRERWWLFGEPRSTFRPALEGLKAYIGTVETAKHRIFTFLPVALATSHKIICIASDDPFHLGVLSSAIHQAWALATGGRLGVGNDPVYTKSKCFDPFPFPEPDSDRRQRIAALAKQLDAHRKAALERDRAVTMTGMYNVVEKLRSREPLAPNERKVHEVAACGVLRDFHDELDRLVAEAYGWPWPLNREETLGRLVALHGERVQEERAGIVRWLRPEYQAPGATAPAPTKRRRKKTDPAQIEFELPTEWPDEVAEQIEAVRMLASHRPITAAEAAAHFGVKDKRIIQHQLELLLLRGEASVVKQPKRSKRKAARRFVCGLVPQPAGALPGPSFDSGRWPEKRKRTTR